MEHQEKSIETISGYVGNLTPHEAQILEKVKDHYLNKLLIRNPRFDDKYFLRFCRARQFDYEKILKMFDEFLKWRLENKVDDIVRYDFPKIPQIWQYYPHGYFGVDKKGRPVYIERYGNLKIKEMFTIMSKEEFINYYIQGYERVVHVVYPECSRAVGKVVERSISILDIKGFGVTQALSGDNQAFLKIAIKIAQDCYPEMMAKMFIVNAGMLFKGLWNMVKPFLDKRTTEKISILGEHYKKELNEWIDDDQLPDFLGGKSQRKLGESFGPWAELYERSKREHSLFLKQS